MRASLCARCLHKLAEVMKEKNLADDYIRERGDEGTGGRVPVSRIKGVSNNQ